MPRDSVCKKAKNDDGARDHQQPRSAHTNSNEQTIMNKMNNTIASTAPKVSAHELDINNEDKDDIGPAKKERSMNDHVPEEPPLNDGNCDKNTEPAKKRARIAMPSIL
jgi:hypothetical protein